MKNNKKLKTKAFDVTVDVETTFRTLIWAKDREDAEIKALALAESDVKKSIAWCDRLTVFSCEEMD